MENVIPAGVTAVGKRFEISAWVIPLSKNGDPGMLTRAEKPITRMETIKRIYFFIVCYFLGNQGINMLVLFLYSSEMRDAVILLCINPHLPHQKF